jgi:uncharacterized protein YecT (DUF1311 family)
MKKLKHIIVICIVLPCTAFGQDVDACLAKADTQSEMNRCEGVNYEKADAELNRVYKLIQKVYKDQNEFLSKLKISQRMWLKLRDADMEMHFPDANNQNKYGSVYPMCHAGFSTAMTLQRIAYLKQWLTGTEEGDVCAGSILRQDSIHDAMNKK